VTKVDSMRVRPGGAASKAADRLGTAFPPYTIVERAGARFGFLGLLSPATKVRPAAGAQAASTVEAITYKIGDAIDAAKKVAPELRSKCDVMIVLAHMDEDEARRLVAAVPGIDFVVLGHDPQGHSFGAPIVVGTTRLLRATAQGQYIGELGIQLNHDHHVADVHNQLHILLASYPDDPDVAREVAEFDEENRKIQKELYAKQQLEAVSEDGLGGRYLGVGTCQQCHADAFQVYMGTAHARAYATLQAQFVHRDTNCVGCHVVGWGDAGGFTGVRKRGTMVDLVDVQCEACHGPGSEHARDGSYREQARKSCVKCHTEETDPSFDYDEDWPKIAH